MPMGKENHQQQDDDRNHGQGAKINDLPGKLRFALLPVVQFGPVFNANLIRMLEVNEEFLG